MDIGKFVVMVRINIGPSISKIFYYKRLDLDKVCDIGINNYD